MDKGLVRSAHDCSDGGLAVSVAECCFGCDGATTINLDAIVDDNTDVWAALFGESLGRIVVSVKPENAVEFESVMQGHAVANIGVVGDKKNLQFDHNGNSVLTTSLSDLLGAWKGTLNMGGGH